MNPKILYILMMLFLAVDCLSKEKTKFYVIDTAKNTIYGIGISADEKGTISLKLVRGGNQKFKKGKYLSAHCPKPKILKKAVKLAKEKKFDEALNSLKKAFSSYCYLGWAGEISLLRSKLYKRSKKFKDAQKVIREGMRFPMNTKSKDALKRAEIDILISLKHYDKAETALKNLNSLESETVIFRNSSTGKILEAKGLKEEAVLQYLKTILLFSKSHKPRKDAYKQVIRLLKDMNDNRYKDFAKQMKADYP